MRVGWQRLPCLYPGLGLAYRRNSFTKYIPDAGAFHDLLIIVRLVKRSDVRYIDHKISHSDPVLKRLNPI